LLSVRGLFLDQCPPLKEPVVHSWILSQEAYGHYYSGDMIEAVDVAKHAQELVPTSPCVGVGLAAALEARANAANEHSVCLATTPIGP
jgi:hypothetical protein